MSGPYRDSSESLLLPQADTATGGNDTPAKAPSFTFLFILLTNQELCGILATIVEQSCNGRKGSKVKTKANTKKKLLIAAGVVVVALAAALIFISNYLVNYAIGRSGNGGDREVALEVDAPADSVEAVMEDNRAAYKSKIDTFTMEHPGRDVTLTADDGLTLHGVYYANAETADTHRWALVLHGYRGDYTGALQLAAPYYEAGYQVIAPDLRACGESEGDYVGMGWLDRKDVLQWIDYIIEQDPEAKIVVHGISMGAATTMMTAGESTPDNVKAFVEDCGYTSVWDIFPVSCSCGSGCRSSRFCIRPAVSPGCAQGTASPRRAPLRR